MNDPDVSYQVLRERRQHFDGMLWQAPVLSLTAQAFLFTISLGAGTTKAARLIASLLSILIAALSVQLMARYRAFEVDASVQLKALEGGVGVHAAHELQPGEKRDDAWLRWLGRHGSARPWSYGLASFGIVSGVVIVLTYATDWLR